MFNPEEQRTRCITKIHKMLKSIERYAPCCKSQPWQTRDRQKNSELKKNDCPFSSEHSRGKYINK